MNYSVDSWRKAITKLIQMTSTGEVLWENYEGYDADVWTEVDRSFSCTLNDKMYVVSLLRSRNYIDEEEFYWVNRTGFSIYKKGFRDVLLGEAPKDLNIVDSLYAVVEESFAYSQNALGDLLS